MRPAKERRPTEGEATSAVYYTDRYKWKSEELHVLTDKLVQELRRIDAHIDSYRKQVDVIYRESDDTEAWAWAMQKVDDGITSVCTLIIDLIHGLRRCKRIIR